MANPQWMYFSRALDSSLTEENSYRRLSLSTCHAENMIEVAENGREGVCVKVGAKAL